MKVFSRLRCCWHWIGAILCGQAVVWGRVPGAIGAAIGTACFISYEIKQDYDKGSGESHKDILEWLIAFIIGLLPIIPLRVLGIL